MPFVEVALEVELVATPEHQFELFETEGVAVVGGNAELAQLLTASADFGTPSTLPVLDFPSPLATVLELPWQKRNWSSQDQGQGVVADPAEGRTQ